MYTESGAGVRGGDAGISFGACTKDGEEYCFEYLNAFVCVVGLAKEVFCGWVRGALPIVKVAGSVLNGADCVRGTDGLHGLFGCDKAGGGEVQGWLLTCSAASMSAESSARILFCGGVVSSSKMREGFSDTMVASAEVGNGFWAFCGA